MDANRADIRKKVVVVGDTTSGKTALLNSFHRGAFILDHIPTVLNNFCSNINVDGKLVELAVFDTAGLPEYDIIRPVSYPKADVILLCVAIDSPSSLQDVPSKWMPELKEHCPRVPIIVVGTKKDLRGRNARCISAEEGEAMADQVKAFGYVECSARSREGVEEAMQVAARVALLHRRRRKKPCIIL